MTHITYAQARAGLAALCDADTTNREVMIIRRRGAEAVALVSAAERDGLTETAHLLRSPKNGEPLPRALARARDDSVAALSVEARSSPLVVFRGLLSPRDCDGQDRIADPPLSPAATIRCPPPGNPERRGSSLATILERNYALDKPTSLA